MPKRFEQNFDVFSGEDRRLDPAQLGAGSPYQLNFEVADKGTALVTRPGFLQITAVERHTAQHGSYVSRGPSLSAIYLRDKGFTGNVYAVSSGTKRDHVIALHQHAFPDSFVFGNSNVRAVQVYPPACLEAGQNEYLGEGWPWGADAGRAQREQVDWRASFVSAHGRLMVFQQHSVPIQVVGGVSFSGMVEDRGSVSVTAAASDDLSPNDDEYKQGWLFAQVELAPGLFVWDSRKITAYDAGTRVLTVGEPWDPFPEIGAAIYVWKSCHFSLGIEAPSQIPESYDPGYDPWNPPEDPDPPDPEDPEIYLYQSWMALIVNGTGKGQARFIQHYAVGAKTLTTTDCWPWHITPDATSQVMIAPYANLLEWFAFPKSVYTYHDRQVDAANASFLYYIGADLPEGVVGGEANVLGNHAPVRGTITSHEIVDRNHKRLGITWIEGKWQDISDDNDDLLRAASIVTSYSSPRSATDSRLVIPLPPAGRIIRGGMVSGFAPGNYCAIYNGTGDGQIGTVVEVIGTNRLGQGSELVLSAGFVGPVDGTSALILMAPYRELEVLVFA